MHKLRFTSAATANIEAIGEYMQLRWGVKQRDVYLHILDACFESLAASPYQGKHCEEIAPGLRRFPKEKHAIFYRVDDEYVTIVHILHAQMHPGLHLQ